MEALAERRRDLACVQETRWRAVALPGGRGEASPLWVDVQKLCNMCVKRVCVKRVCVCAFIVMEILRITRQIHCKAVEQTAMLIHRQYNRDWGTSYSRPPIDPYLTSPLLQNPGGATGGEVVGVGSLVL